jgi:hypothetical protein
LAALASSDSPLVADAQGVFEVDRDWFVLTNCPFLERDGIVSFVLGGYFVMFLLS